MSHPEDKKLAKEIWDKLDKNQKTAIRFGMFPAEVMKQYSNIQELAVLLMECAKEDGGMRA